MINLHTGMRHRHSYSWAPEQVRARAASGSWMSRVLAKVAAPRHQVTAMDGEAVSEAPGECYSFGAFGSIA